MPQYFHDYLHCHQEQCKKKDQIPQLLTFALNHGLKYDLLTWHKTNPVPTCNNKYLSDTEYIIFMRNGANLYGSYSTKRKYFITPTNTEDKKAWKHPCSDPSWPCTNPQHDCVNCPRTNVCYKYKITGHTEWAGINVKDIFNDLNGE